MKRTAAVAVPLAALLALSLPSTATLVAQEDSPLAFLRGDVNADGNVSISDSLMLRRWLFNGDRPPPCHDAADALDDGLLNISDQIFILNFAFLGGPAPAAPFPEAGPDATPGDGLGCESYAVEPPEQTDDLIRIGDVQGAAGETVLVPVYVRSSVDVEAFQVVIGFDPNLIQYVRGPTATAVAGTFYDGHVAAPFFGGNTVEAGVAAVGFIPSFIEEGYELPASSDETLVFHLQLRIADGVPDGTELALEPTNGPNGEGSGAAKLRNELTHRGDARFVSIVPRTEGGFLQIVPDQTFFIRGDVNDDDKVELSDAQFTLNFLFLGEQALGCGDAADANDDGRVDIADPIYVLSFLFLGGPDMPPPISRRGIDPTPDDIDCGGSGT